MTSERDELEQDLRIDQMRADIENKRMDTAYKQGLLRFEPWKIGFTAFAAGVAALAAAVGAGVALGRVLFGS
jgi:hypothetical protein